MTNIKGVIFDVDGTLLDSMPIWENMASDYLIEQGVTPRPDLCEDLFALGGHEIPKYFQVEYGLRQSAETIQRGMYKLLEDFYFHKALPKHGVVAVLEAFRTHGMKMCVATATDRHLIEPALMRCGLLNFFDRIFTCGEEVTSKSCPDIYIRAAAFLGTGISETLVVEDALYAIRSAKNAGFSVVGVYDLSARDKQNEIKELSDYYFMKMDEIFAYL